VGAHLKRKWQEQGSGRGAECRCDDDEIIHVAATAAAFGAADGDVREGTPQRRAENSQFVLSHPAHDSKVLDRASGVEAGGAYFDRSGSHDI
jgi:hypothetical protein